MQNEIDDFVAEGLKKYKKAAATLVSFGRELETRLQLILSERSSEEWGRFVPDDAKKAKSTKYWSEYPLFNAKIDGRIAADNIRITIDINWYRSESEYPFYAVWLGNRDLYQSALDDFVWQHGIHFFEGAIRFDPDEKDFDLKRDFGLLLDEAVRFLNQYPP